MNIILIGFKNSGKTTVGKKLAEKLHYPFIDVDHLIEANFAKENNLQKDPKLTTRQIYQQQGETVFRQLEYKAITQLTATENALIATGGGSVMNPDSAKILQEIGTIIYLYASKEFLSARNKLHATPAFLDDKDPEKSFSKLYETRQDIYKRVANYKISIENKSGDEIAQEIMNLIDAVGNSLG